MDIKQYLVIQGSTKGEAQRSSTSRWELGAFWCLPQKALKSHIICVGAGEPGKNQSYLPVLGWAGTDCFRISNIFTSRIKSRVINNWGGGWSPHVGGGLIAKSCPTLVTPRTVACQVPLSMGFCRQEYWSGLLFPSPGDLPEPRIEPWSPTLQADSLLTELWGKPASHVIYPQLHLSSAVSKMAWAKSLPIMGPRYPLKDLGSGKFSSLIYFFLRKTEIYLRGKKKRWPMTELLPLCSIFPVSRAAWETKNAFILWKGMGAGKETETRGLCNHGILKSLQEVYVSSPLKE